MFWKLTALSASSPVETVLDKENFTLEELLEEEEIIQECKALNSRLINFLRDRYQVEQLLHYIIDEAPEDADSRRAFKFPFVACEIFTCEIDVILKTLVEEEELMTLLFSFLEPNRAHSALLAGYFSKVVICLMLRKSIHLMNYVKAHQDVFVRLVDLIGITSIMEVLVRLVGADDRLYTNSSDVMQWLADSNLLEMIVDKLNAANSCEIHANAAETLCSITRTAPSPLATKLSSLSFVTRIFGHALEDLHSKSSLVNSLSVCISLLDPKRSLPPPVMYSFRNQRAYESPLRVNAETVSAMLPHLDQLLRLLIVKSDENILPTTFGELKPPLGKHRLKVVEFLSVLLKSGNEAAVKALVGAGAIQRILDLFFEYPYNNALHHHVESIVFSVLESKDDSIVDHLLLDCNLIGKIIFSEKSPTVSGTPNLPTAPVSRREAPRAGYFGHLTRISNKLIQLGNSDSHIQKYLQENDEWSEWQTTVLQERNTVENVYKWACGRPTALQDRVRDSDEEDTTDKDFDVAALANNLSQAFRYNVYDNDDAEMSGNRGHGSHEHDDEEDSYFDDESAEVVISSLRLSDDHGSSLFTNSNWFAFKDDRKDGEDGPSSDAMEDINFHSAFNGGSSSSDDEVVVGEDEEMVESSSPNVSSSFTAEIFDGYGLDKSRGGGDDDDMVPNPPPQTADDDDKAPPVVGDLNFFRFEASENDEDDDDPFEDGRPIPEWVAWGEEEGLDFPPSGSSATNPFGDLGNVPGDSPLPNGDDRPAAVVVPESETTTSLFEEDVEFVDGTAEKKGSGAAAVEERKTEQQSMMKKKKKKNKNKKGEGDDSSGDGSSELKEFNDTNYWRVDQEVTVLE